jgi:tRNA (cmo5U34)-methyltransferase
MIRQCHAKLDREGLAGRVQLHLGYTQDLPREAQYDAATLVLVMHFVPDDGAKLALLRSIAERLRPGGALVLVDHHGAPDSMEFQHLLAGWRNYQVLMGMPAAEAEAVLAQAVKTHHFISDTRTRELLQEAGFETVERFYGAFVTAGWFAQTHQ